MQDEELLRYSRHILLSGFDLSGQEKLAASKVLIIGAGGLGCPLALYLAASGVGELVLADFDVVEISNLQRQIGHVMSDIGMLKVHSLSEKIRAINPLVRVRLIEDRIQGDALEKAISSVDLVVDGSDNFVTRMAVNASCVRQCKVLVSGAAIRYEGQVSVFNLTDTSPCYACLYGGEAIDDEVATCSDSGVLSPLVGIVGSMMAAEVIKVIAGVGDVLDGRVLIGDVQTMDWRTLVLKKDDLCQVCSRRG